MVGELLFFIQNLFKDVYSRIVKSIYLPSLKYVAGVAYVVMYAFLVGLPLATIPGGRFLLIVLASFLRICHTLDGHRPAKYFSLIGELIVCLGLPLPILVLWQG